MAAVAAAVAAAAAAAAARSRAGAPWAWPAAPSRRSAAATASAARHAAAHSAPGGGRTPGRPQEERRPGWGGDHRACSGRESKPALSKPLASAGTLRRRKRTCDCECEEPECWALGPAPRGLRRSARAGLQAAAAARERCLHLAGGA
ncbi:homeobox even-skipped homolog protein 2-like [Cebus imitator]|uniref:homeobox even-skipped homolog protein 2-like n=1 Tax=Cebus imitator TaxID=2715852 RepID=UPI00189B70A9|nr:homeobox even-skipped homolog protein 2-like [Cebus imitator]